MASVPEQGKSFLYFTYSDFTSTPHQNRMISIQTEPHVKADMPSARIIEVTYSHKVLIMRSIWSCFTSSTGPDQRYTNNLFWPWQIVWSVYPLHTHTHVYLWCSPINEHLVLWWLSQRWSFWKNIVYFLFSFFPYVCTHVSICRQQHNTIYGCQW